MKKGILYNLFKIYNRDLSDCISELNVSVESAAYHIYPKCLLLSNRISKEERDKIKLNKFDTVITYDQRFNALADKLIAFEITPFDKNILIDSDIIFLNEKSYDVIECIDNNRILDIPFFDLEHLFNLDFALCQDILCFKKSELIGHIIDYKYNPLSFEYLYQKYNNRKNVFTYNNSVMCFDKTDVSVKGVFEEAIENAKYLTDIRDSTKISVMPCDQVCLDFSIANRGFYPRYIHRAFSSPLPVINNKICLDQSAIMCHSSSTIQFIIKNKIDLF